MCIRDRNGNAAEGVVNIDITGHSRHEAKKKKSLFFTASEKFEGTSDDPDGHAFDCSGVQQADQCTVTKRQIEEFIGWTCECGSNIKASLETSTEFVPTEPSDTLDTASRMELKIHDEKIDLCMKRCD